MLMQRSDLPFDEVMALDRIQKGRPIADDMLRRLRRKGLVEGRKGQLRVAASVAESTGTKVPYLELRGHSDEYCMGVINDLLHSSGPLTRHDVDAAVFSLLSVSLTHEQKTNRVDYLLKKMRREGKIQSVWADGRRVWELT